MFESFLEQRKFSSEVEEEYLEWIFERRKKFIVWVAAVVSLFLLYFTVRDFNHASSTADFLITLSFRVVEIFFTVCVVLLFLWVRPLKAQRLLLYCMLVITVAAVGDSYFWVKNIYHHFNLTAQMFAVYIFMIVPYTSVVHKFILGVVFVCGILICSAYLDIPLRADMVFYMVVIFISEVAISFKIDTLMRVQFKAVLEGKKQTAELRKSAHELKSALEAEREAIKQNLNFIDMISHEYRTPLSIITSCVDSLETLESINSSECASHTVKTIREASRRLLSIYESSLHEKRINAAGLMPYKKKVGIFAIVELAVDFVRSTYSEHSIFIDDDACPYVLVNADSELLVTAFINVLDNACKYSPPSRVVVCMIQKGAECIIKITDQGCGIDNSEIDVVFEKYYRSGMTKQKPGAGVGLYLVRKIVELHGGSIRIASQRQAGTTVEIIIPISEDNNDE